MILKRCLPRTLAGQLVALLFGVLIIAQFINLALLIGVQRFQARSNAYSTAMDYSARLMEQLPDAIPADLPYYIQTERGGAPGSFFLSTKNRADKMTARDPDASKNWIDLPRYNNRFRALLNERGIFPRQTAMTFLPDGPPRSPRLNDKGPYRNDITPKSIDERRYEDRPRRPPSPERGRADYDRRPPPHLQRDRRGPPPNGLPRPDASTKERPKGRPGSGPDFGRGFETKSGLRPVPNSGPPSRGRNDPMNILPFVQEVRLSAEIAPGIWFNAIMHHAETESLTGRILLATALLLGFSLLAVWFFARRLSRPISKLARAAEQLGRGEDPDPLSESGPIDMQLAAGAFNKMQTRVTRMLETQRMMLRAVGHDLRTPLTTLRLRAENIDDETEREKVITTLQDMTVMTEEILSWAKDASGTEELAFVDLRSLLESLTDDYQDQGHDVSLQDFEPFDINIRRTSVKRALQNLINNALKFAGCAMLSVEREPKRIIIHVDDNGSGVPEAELENILKPFIRLETSRNKETGGTGLGLSIASSIAQIHGGTLKLSNRETGGLRVSLTLPH